MKFIAVQCSAVQCSAGAVSSTAVKYSAVQYSAVQCSAIYGLVYSADTKAVSPVSSMFSHAIPLQQMGDNTNEW